jgi:hypothetical protein
MKSKLLALVVGTAASFGAMAAPSFYLNSYAGWDGSFSIKLAGYEAFTGGLVAGSENFGVLKVTSILDGSGNHTLWTDGQGGAEITGIFSGIKIDTVSVGPFGDARVLSTGGLSSFFINPFGSLLSTTGGLGFSQGLGGYAAGGCAVNQNCYKGISNVAGGGSMLDVKWVSGVDNNLGAPYDTKITVDGTFVSTSNPQSGFAAGYMSVTGGTYATTFDTNSFTFSKPGNAPADLRANNTFCTPGANCSATVADAGGLPTAGGWALRIDDPVNGRVPEPGSIALVGLGLLAAGFARRRKA